MRSNLSRREIVFTLVVISASKGHPSPAGVEDAAVGRGDVEPGVARAIRRGHGHEAQALRLRLSRLRVGHHLRHVSGERHVNAVQLV